jgi:hypothetical protein
MKCGLGFRTISLNRNSIPLISNERTNPNPNCYYSGNRYPYATNSYGIAGGGSVTTSEEIAQRVKIEHGVALQRIFTYHTQYA